MADKIEDIEGIGPTYGAKLKAANINTTDDLLDRCGSAKGRSETATATGLSEGQLLKWANLADLMRLKGVGTQFAELLEAAGVDTVKELRQRVPANLAAKMKTVNEEKKLTRVTPTEQMVTDWVAQAKTMEPKVSH